ncbi:MAG TPA: hypothetical protein VGI40_00820 [Pirellulaceae bacterium]|jgi:hypothetical protein
MSSGHMSSGDNARRDEKIENNREDLPPEPTGDLPADVLSEIVAETTAQLASAEPIDPALHAAMVAIAREYAGHPMTVEPGGAALLAAVLQHQFSFLATRPALLNRAAKTVAESLLADLTARRRLEHVWAKLLEEVA